MPRVKIVSQEEKGSGRFRRAPDRAHALRFSVVTRLGPDAQDRLEQEPEHRQLVAEGRA